MILAFREEKEDEKKGQPGVNDNIDKDSTSFIGYFIKSKTNMYKYKKPYINAYAFCQDPSKSKNPYCN